MALCGDLGQVYGMSENFGTTTLSAYNCWRTGSVGVPAPEVQLKIARDGEIWQVMNMYMCECCLPNACYICGDEQYHVHNALDTE